MTQFAAHPSMAPSIHRPTRSARPSVGRLAMVATAIVVEAVLTLAVVLSTIGAGSEAQPSAGPRIPAPAALSR
jgi:hypothetical protein